MELVTVVDSDVRENEDEDDHFGIRRLQLPNLGSLF